MPATTTTLVSPRVRQSAYFDITPVTTPSRRKRSFVPDSKSSGTGEAVIVEAGPQVNKLDFSCLEESFGCCSHLRRSNSASPIRKVAFEHETSKRRKVGPLHNRIQPPKVLSAPIEVELSPAPPLAVEKGKKKRTASNKTVTARAIARYTRAEEVVTKPKTSPHFVAEAHKTVQPKPRKRSVKRKTDKQPKPRKKAGKEEGKKSKSLSSSKQTAPIVPKLASPEQHSAKIQRQNILFGTSSQLNCNESADYIRDMQRAIVESEAASHLQQSEMMDSWRPSKSRAIRRARGGLWAQGSYGQLEDEDGDASSLSVSKQQHSKLEDIQHENNRFRAIADTDRGFIDIDNLCPVKALDALPPVQRAPSPTARTPPSYQSSLPVVKPLFCVPSLSGNAHLSRTALRPLSTNSKPARSTSLTESPKKSPAKTQDTANGSESHKPKTAKRPRGRPRTSAEPVERLPRRRGRPPKSPILEARSLLSTPQRQEWTSVHLDTSDDSFDAIEDLEVNGTPTPPRRKPGSPSKTPMLPLTATTIPERSPAKRSNTMIVNPLHPRWPEVQARLFPQILDAVRSAPPSVDVKTPSWYDKMLMYDPIVLEDLTDWLNQQGLRVEGKDGELVMISAWMVQIWCENNSICCLWKEGLRGGVRTRY